MQYVINFIDYTSVLNYEITFDGFLNPLVSGKEYLVGVSA